MSLPNPQREAQVFWRLRLQIVRASVSHMLRHARLRVSLVVTLSSVFWLGLFALFFLGFQYLSMHTEIVQPLYNAFFLSLMAMLVLSSGLIMYSGLYRAPEAMFLLTTPVRPQRIFAHKLQEAIWFSSWGFILLGSPMLVAYGIAVVAPWYYYLLLFPFMLAFVHIPAAIGGILCLLVVDRLPALRRQAMAILCVGALAAATWLAWTLVRGATNDLMTPGWFQELSARLRVTEQRLLPSWWLSTGLLEATRIEGLDSADDHPWSESILFLALLVSNALFFHQAGAWLAGRVYRASFSRLQSLSVARRRASVTWLDRLAGEGLPFLPRHVRLLLVKDFRLFRRDPVQWSQFLIFFGLLALYFVNIRRFNYNISYSAMIGFLNLAVVGLILSTFTTRFIFPMISLEGRRFWILGRLPLHRDAIVWAKFVFAVAGSVPPCGALILLSDLMLDLAPLLIAIHQVCCVALCVGLSAIAVGLGAAMPDLREESPTKIAAGFGGTLNLVFSAIYIVVVVLATAVPCHFYLTIRQGPGEISTLARWLSHPAALAGGVLLVLIAATAATILPLRAGLRTFRRLEF